MTRKSDDAAAIKCRGSFRCPADLQDRNIFIRLRPRARRIPERRHRTRFRRDGNAFSPQVAAVFTDSWTTKSYASAESRQALRDSRHRDTRDIACDAIGYLNISGDEARHIGRGTVDKDQFNVETLLW